MSWDDDVGKNMLENFSFRQQKTFSRVPTENMKEGKISFNRSGSRNKTRDCVHVHCSGRRLCVCVREKSRTESDLSGGTLWNASGLNVALLLFCVRPKCDAMSSVYRLDILSLFIIVGARLEIQRLKYFESTVCDRKISAFGLWNARSFSKRLNSNWKINGRGALLMPSFLLFDFLLALERLLRWEIKPFCDW